MPLAVPLAEKIDLEQLTQGSRMCVLSDAGHVAVATYRGKSGQGDSGTYVTVDLRIWRDAQEARSN